MNSIDAQCFILPMGIAVNIYRPDSLAYSYIFNQYNVNIYADLGISVRNYSVYARQSAVQPFTKYWSGTQGGMVTLHFLSFSPLHDSGAPLGIQFVSRQALADFSIAPRAPETSKMMVYVS